MKDVGSGFYKVEENNCYVVSFQQENQKLYQQAAIFFMASGLDYNIIILVK